VLVMGTLHVPEMVPVVVPAKMRVVVLVPVLASVHRIWFVGKHVEGLHSHLYVGGMP